MFENKIESFIKSHSDEGKKNFSTKLVKTSHQIYGVKICELEKFIKENIRDKNINFSEFSFSSHEEILMAGFFIGYSKEDIEIKKGYLRSLLPYIDNWETCDTIVSRLKCMKEAEQFFIDLLKHNNPFYKRVGIVWLMKFKLKEDFDKIMNIFSNVKDDNYFVKMALSWAYCEAFIINFEKSYEYLLKETDVFIKNKTISKCCDSYRISENNKKILKKIRKI